MSSPSSRLHSRLPARRPIGRVWPSAVSLLALAACQAPTDVDDTDRSGRGKPTLNDLMESIDLGVSGPMPVHAPIGVGFTGPMGTAVPMATPDQLAAFARGEALARRRFTPEEGLGPQFNGVSCLSCHEKPMLGGGAELYRNVAIGGQWEDGRGYVITPTVPETNPVAVNDGVFRLYNMDDLGGPGQQAIQPEVGLFASRNPPALFGSGVAMTIDASDIEALADPDDQDGDGVSGRVNENSDGIGRLGSKAEAAGHTSMVRTDLYMSSSLSSAMPNANTIGALPFPDQLHPVSIFVLDLDDPTPDPELVSQDMLDVLIWSQLLAAVEFDPLDRTSGRGRDLFEAIGCDACHTPRLPSPYGPIPAYTDYLLHDMGPDLADGYVFAESTGDEFKTPALWAVAATGPYLHDGRAKTLDEAIRWHGGEAADAHDLYLELTDADQGAIIAFLRTLGGASLESDGLLPPNAPLRPEATLGGPMPGLSVAELQLFERGRALFDYAFGVTEGVGNPAFNGDSCRACHSDPYIGGSGPLDVNVLRMGNVDRSGVAHALPEGSMIHRVQLFESAPARLSTNANVVELRQTPALFGYGLIDGIPESAIRANADADDVRAPFGISGRPGLSHDGRVARFGWKAQVPTLYEFTEGALTDEMGLTVPVRGGPELFGGHHDLDRAPDPEVSTDDVYAIAAFVASLAPPPRGPITADVLDGDAVFDRVGCDDCHVRSLDGAAGPVPLFSDLLLHEILPPGARGIEQGSAGQTEFRTSPLWGVSHTGPWLHTGRATTLDDAIRGHAGEGAASRDAYAHATQDERDALLVFLQSL